MKNLIYTLLGTALIIACGTDKKAKTVAIEPSEAILKKLDSTNFSILLDDMKIEKEPKVIAYKHKYKVLKMVGDSLHQEQQPWQDVNKSFYEAHTNDLGMEILSQHDGKVSRVAQPAGFGWAIGNEKHGEWVEEKSKDSTVTKPRRRWRTFGSSPFLWYWLGTRRSYYRNDFNRYQTENRNGRAYYGASSATGRYDYGTRSTYQKEKRKSYFTRTKTNRLKRSSSRFSKGSKTRSRSGGFGK